MRPATPTAIQFGYNGTPIEFSKQNSSNFRKQNCVARRQLMAFARNDNECTHGNSVDLDPCVSVDRDWVRGQERVARSIAASISRPPRDRDNSPAIKKPGMAGP